MKLTTPIIMTAKSGNTGVTGFGQNEKKDARIARMKAFWGDKMNAILYPVGLLLASKVDATRTIADVLAAGEDIELSHIVVAGKHLHHPTGSFKLSLDSANFKTWACPACSSAHGSGVYPSREVDADGLAHNKFYYRPSDGALFTISDTCWTSYAKRLLGDNVSKRFVAPSKDVVFATVQAAKQITA